ncbi:hypothetical protein ACFSNO_04650, partial [Streptomyces cirratus]
MILAAPERVEIPFGNTTNREMSTSWRGRPEEAGVYRDQVQDYLVGLTEKVKVVPKSDATLSGHSAIIPVSVQKQPRAGRPQPGPARESANPTRLMFGDSGV